MRLLVKPPPMTCLCSRCKHHREDREAFAAFQVEEHAEWTATELEQLWHDYQPALDSFVHTMPTRARSAVRGKRVEMTAALRGLIDWCVALDGPLATPNVAVLSGPPGVGKTCAAVWLCLYRFAAEDAEFIGASSLARVPRHGEQRELLLDRDCRPLVIDDLGIERADEKFRADLDELFDSVYRSVYTPCVITTNLTGAQIRGRYGERVADRIRECATWIPCRGESMRRGAA